MPAPNDMPTPENGTFTPSDSACGFSWKMIAIASLSRSVRTTLARTVTSPLRLTASCGVSMIRAGFGASAPQPASASRQAAESVALMELDYVVLTSVDRDDLPDGGSGVFAACSSKSS